MAEEKMPLSDDIDFGGSVSDKGTGNAVKHEGRITALSSCKQRSKDMFRYLKTINDEFIHQDHVRIDSLKNQGLDASPAIDPKHQERLKLQSELGACANWLVFNNYYTVDEIRLAKARTCKKHLLCPFCARARSHKLNEKNIPKLEEAIQEHPNAIPAILTLTVKNDHDLEKVYKHLTNSFNSLKNRRRMFLKTGYGQTEFKKVLGALFSTEITYNPKTGFHPHIHAVVLLDSYMDQKALSEEWLEITGDSKIVGITKLKGSPVEAMQEVFKYATKFQELPFEQNLQIYDVLKGKRLIGTLGCFHGLKVPEKLTDELLEDLPFIEMFYKFNKRTRSYQLTDTKHQDSNPNPMPEPDYATTVARLNKKATRQRKKDNELSRISIEHTVSEYHVKGRHSAGSQTSGNSYLPDDNGSRRNGLDSGRSRQPVSFSHLTDDEIPY